MNEDTWKTSYDEISFPICNGGVKGNSYLKRRK